MPEAVAILFIVLTIAIVVASHHKQKSAKVALEAISAGGCAFGVAFLAQLLFLVLGIENQFLDVVIEEAIKVIAVWFFVHTVSPVAITASFGSFEAIFGKLLFLFWLSPPERVTSLAGSEAYLLTVMLAAYLMHVSTGLVYASLGIGKGLAVAIILHSGFNMMANRAEAQFTMLAAGGLLLASVAMIAAAVGVMKIAPQFMRSS